MQHPHRRNSGIARALPAFAFTLLAATAPAVSSHAQDREPTIQELRDQIRALDEKLRALEAKQEKQEQDAAAAAKKAPKITVSDRGFSLASADGAHSIKLRGLVQADSRWFFDDGGTTNNDSFILRRARIMIEGQIGGFVGYQVVPEFAGSSFTLMDANVSLDFSDVFSLTIGKQKTPVALENLQSDSVVFFIERSIVSGLTPGRDLGVVAGGDLLDGKLSYSAGVFNGVADSANGGNADYDDDKALVARVFVHPFKGSDSALAGLGVGLGGSFSATNETASSLTSGYKTDGQQTFFKYATGTVGAGDAWRWSPQAYYYGGPLGLMAEYVESTVNVTNGVAPETELTHKGWQLAAGYVLTGENAGYKGVSPKTPFSLEAGTWGAFEVVARVAQLDIDDATFPTFASANSAATEATSYGIGVNWYPVRLVRASLDYFHTDFDAAGASPSVLLRQGENALLTRLQVSF